MSHLLVARVGGSARAVAPDARRGGARRPASAVGPGRRCIVHGVAWLLILQLACARSGFEQTPCDDQGCSGHGVCGVTFSGQARCACDPGYHNQGPLACASSSGAALDAGDADAGAVDAAQDAARAEPVPPPPLLEQPWILRDAPPDRALWIDAPTFELRGRCDQAVQELKLYDARGGARSLAHSCPRDGRFTAVVETPADRDTYSLAASSPGGETRGPSFEVVRGEGELGRPQVREVTTSRRLARARFAVDARRRLALLTATGGSAWSVVRVDMGTPPLLAPLPRVQLGSGLEGDGVFWDRGGRPVLLGTRQLGVAPALVVLRLAPEGWREDDLALDAGLGIAAALALTWSADDRALLAVQHHQLGATQSQSHIWLWDEGFVPLGQPPEVETGGVDQVALTFLEDRSPAVALRRQGQVQVHRWQGDAWQPLGDVLPVAATTSPSHLALLSGPLGDAWVIGARATARWTGTRWDLHALPGAAETRIVSAVASAEGVHVLTQAAGTIALLDFDEAQEAWQRAPAQPAAPPGAGAVQLVAGSGTGDLFVGWLLDGQLAVQRLEASGWSVFADSAGLREGTFAAHAAVEVGEGERIDLLLLQGGWLYLSTWDGQRWNEHAARLVAPDLRFANRGQPVSTLGPDGTLYTVGLEGEAPTLFAWRGDRWEAHGALPVGWVPTDILVDTSQVLIPAIDLAPPEQMELAVWRADAGAGFSPLGEPLTQGYSMQLARVALDDQGRPVLAWNELDLTLRAARFEAGAWQETFGDFGWHWQTAPALALAPDGALYLLQTHGATWAYQRSLFTWSEVASRWQLVADLPAAWSSPPDVMHPFNHGEPSSLALLGATPWVALKELLDAQSTPVLGLYHPGPQGWVVQRPALPAEAFGGLHAGGGRLFWSWLPALHEPSFGGFRLARLEAQP